MRLVTASRYALLTGALVLLSAALLAICSGPVLADPVVGGSPTTTESTATAPDSQQAPDGDSIAIASGLDSFAKLSPAKRPVKVFAAHLKVRRMKQLRKAETFYCSAANQWAQVMGVPVQRPSSRLLASASFTSARRGALECRDIARRMRHEAQHPPHLSDWLCIHHYEGSWNDSGGPYWGGLQMSLSFQKRYGGWLFRIKGTADHWTPLEQIWVAEKALSSRGFWPWPNTARDCGLL